MTHTYGDSLAWSDLSVDHRETVSRLVADLGLGNPETHWSQLDYRARWESTWRFENPHEDYGMYQAEVDRIKAQADADTLAVFNAQPVADLPYTNGHVAYTEDDDHLKLIDWAQVQNPDDDLVEGLIMRSRWTQFIAAAKNGKSSLLAWMAIELSEGRDPWDQTAQQALKVLWCDGEMGRLDLEELIRDFGHDPLELTSFYATEDQLRLDTRGGAERLLEAVDSLGIDVVVFDGLNSFITAESSENSSETWLPLMKHTIRPLKIRGLAIISADNLGKDKTRGSRGSSIKTDKADGVVAVHRTDKGVRLEVTHARGGAFLRNDLVLEAEGFDRAVPIRYWRVAGGWPAGTLATAQMLDELEVPVTDSRVKVRARLKAEIATAQESGSDASGFQVRNDILSAAIRSRRQRPVILGKGLKSGPQNLGTA